MQFPIVNATIKLSPIKKEKNTTTGNLFVVKEVKSASQRLKPTNKQTAGSKVVEVSVPREELRSRLRYEHQCSLPRVPLIEVKINKHGFQVRRLLRMFPNRHIVLCDIKSGVWRSHDATPLGLRHREFLLQLCLMQRHRKLHIIIERMLRLYKSESSSFIKKQNRNKSNSFFVQPDVLCYAYLT